MQKSSTVAVINRDNQVLILLRGKTAPWMPSKYCLPGGKVEENENLVDAVVRELFEETNISCNIESLYPHTIQYKNGKSKIVFSTKIDNPIVQLNWEHEDYSWVDLSSIENYNLVPGLYTSIKTILVNYANN
jgi:8-oxo-dGTP pyrophosphatase MutT (NUDIX family)